MPMKHTFSDKEDLTHVDSRDRTISGSSYSLPYTFLDSAFQAIISASDGKTYFAVSCHEASHNAQFFAFDPGSKSVRHIKDIGQWCGQTEPSPGVSVQGKVHTNIYEANNALYFATTLGYSSKDQPYRGGCILRYSIHPGTCEKLVQFEDIDGGGLIALVFEPLYHRIYALHQRHNTLISYDLHTGQLLTLGSVQQGKPTRDMIVDDDGTVYGSDRDGLIWRYDPAVDRISCLLTRIPFDSQAVQPIEQHERGNTCWGQARWDPVSQWWYAIRRNDEFLFRFRTPQSQRSHRAQAEGLVSLGHLPNHEQQPRNSSLGFALLHRFIYYCSIIRDWPEGRFVDELSHDLGSCVGVQLMRYHIDSGRVDNLGQIRTADGRIVAQCHSMTAGSNGNLHLVAAVFSRKNEDPANDWLFGGRHGCYTHMRIVTLDPSENA